MGIFLTVDVYFLFLYYDALVLFIYNTLEGIGIMKLKLTLNIQYYTIHVMFLFSKSMFWLSLALDFYVLLFYFVLVTFFLQNTLVICFLVANQIINIYGSCWQILLQCRWPTMSKKLTLIGLISVSVKSVPNEFFWPKIFLEFVFFF